MGHKKVYNTLSKLIIVEVWSFIYFERTIIFSILFNIVVCTLPLEYCEYNSGYDKCKEWLLKNMPEMFAKLDTNGIILLLNFYP